MTIKEYLQRLNALPHRNAKGQTLAEVAPEYTHIWDNETCRGYAIIAMRNTGFTEAQIRAVSNALSSAFDNVTMDEANDTATHF